ncbi:response regulator transcription factor [Pseudobacteriovorax antillogorgiicola]|uniref:DNA-binding response regulator, OmpR family, contains REC and winged-helix (WHTH) domain n=1 Tax=Pseudobacteriovorax antillogorgiicola TaxID=1513793 RepID=A0A1Y6CT65_9BACT|nr:response regulator [Pseudobacteriovorax antillogorgiicola]TCS45028.1 DNA-binding response OmpR family regulator [Pseudobacteriovorax antillogorgiicola]SMF76206.1 DNA-binding response regulator, OmpR family, contains REC and winged-helix (wHTH) domain [Pseudobacteriovorax antillogorgiicola]
MSAKPLIWIIDDQPEFLNNLELAFKIFYEVKSFVTSEALLAEISKPDVQYPQLLVSDLVLENDTLLIHLLEREDMQNFLKRSQILVLSGNPSQEVITRLLELGVIDFISKPANIDELIVKINRAIAKPKQDNGLVSYHSEISTDPTNRIVHCEGRSAEELTGREFQVLTAILRAGEDGLGKKDLIKEVWSGKAIDPSALSVHLTSLRKKIKEIGVNVTYNRSTDTYSIAIADSMKQVS